MELVMETANLASLLFLSHLIVSPQMQQEMRRNVVYYNSIPPPKKNTSLNGENVESGKRVRVDANGKKNNGQEN